jgi:uncharacterized membrane protein
MTTMTFSSASSAPSAITPRFVLSVAALAALATLVLMALSALISGKAEITYDDAPIALAIHVATVIPSLFLGGYVMLARKGTRIHKVIGRIWAMAMMVTAISSFWLQGLTGGIGPIHIFSVLTLVSIPRAIWAIRKGNVAVHQRAMTGPYIGLLVAGLFSFMPGRLLGNLVLSLFS